MTDMDTGRERRSFAVRVSAMFAAIFVVAGTNLPFLPVWLDWAGLGSREIAIITATPLFVRLIVTPAVAFAADRAGDHRRYLIGLSWAGLFALVVLTQSRGFGAIFLCMVAFALAWTTVMPLTETVAMGGVRAVGLDYGRMRVWGSLSFIVASFTGGWAVEQLGSGAAIWLIVAGMALTTAAAHSLPRPIRLGQPEPKSGAPRLSVTGAAGLLRMRIFLVFLAASGLTQASHAVFYTFGTLHWRELGLLAGSSGALWAISIVAEVALFACSAAVVRRIGAEALIMLGACAAVIRWLAMSFDPALALLVPLQLLHALTFGAAHLGAMHFIGRSVPPAQAGTAQALYASVTSGIAMGGAMLMSGPLYAAYAGRAYLAMALVGAVALAAGLVLLRAKPRKVLLQPQS